MPRKRLIRTSTEAIDSTTEYEKEQDYQELNEKKFSEMLKILKPELWVLEDILVQTNVSWWVLVKIVRALAYISTNHGGNGFGEVKILIQNDRVTFIHGTDSYRVEEALIKPIKDKK